MNEINNIKYRLKEYLSIEGIPYDKNHNTWKCPCHDDNKFSAVYYETGKNSDTPVLWCPVHNNSMSVFDVAGKIHNTTDFKEMLKIVRETLNITEIPVINESLTPKKKQEASIHKQFPTERTEKDKINNKIIEISEKNIDKWGIRTSQSWKYFDESGKIVAIDIRYEKEGERKTVQTFWYDGQLKWYKTPVFIYNAHKIKEDKPIVIHEGAKCAAIATENLPEFTHISWSGGSSKADKVDWSILKDKEVYILPDNDEPGQKAAKQIKKQLPSAIIIKNTSKEKGGDIEQILQIMSPEEFTKHINDLNIPEEKEIKDYNNIELNSTDPDLNFLVNASWMAIAKKNTPVRLALYGGLPSRITVRDNVPRIETLNKYMLQLESASAINWVDKKENRIHPPMAIQKNMLACETAHIPLPDIKRITTTPVFDKSANIIDEPGFNDNSGIYYHPGDLVINDIPENPTTEDVEYAKHFVDQIFQDFPFASESDRATAWASIFVLPMREMLDKVPIVGYESPTPGTGKGLLCESSLYAFSGGNIEKFSPSRNEEEERKRYTAALGSGKPVIMLDNFEELAGSQIATVLTTDQWSDRKLGESKILNYKVTSQFVVTANNIILTTENKRRYVRCRMIANMENPWMRTGFKIDDLMTWVKENRSELVWCILVMIRSWVNSGMKLFMGKKIGSYESFSRKIGGVLEHIGIKGFLDNLEEVYASSDIEGNAMHEFVEKWWDRFDVDPKKSSDLFDIVDEIDLPLSGNTYSGKKRSFARYLVKQVDNVYNIEYNDSIVEVQIVSVSKKQRASVYKLNLLGRR